MQNMATLWIIEGPAATGKSFLSRHLSNMLVIEADCGLDPGGYAHYIQTNRRIVIITQDATIRQVRDLVDEVHRQHEAVQVFNWCTAPAPANAPDRDALETLRTALDDIRKLVAGDPDLLPYEIRDRVRAQIDSQSHAISTWRGRAESMETRNQKLVNDAHRLGRAGQHLLDRNRELRAQRDRYRAAYRTVVAGVRNETSPEEEKAGAAARNFAEEARAVHREVAELGSAVADLQPLRQHLKQRAEGLQEQLESANAAADRNRANYLVLYRAARGLNPVPWAERNATPDALGAAADLRQALAPRDTPTVTLDDLKNLLDEYVFTKVRAGRARNSTEALAVRDYLLAKLTGE